LAALGLFLVLLKIGRPSRFMFVLRQPGRSWMTREAWIATGLFPLGAVAALLASPVLMAAAAVLGLSFLVSQAMILHEAKGIPAWRSPAIVPLIVATGMAEGSGMFLVATALLPPLGPMAEIAAVAATMLAALRAWTWGRYLTSLRIEGAPVRAIAVLDAFRPWLLALGLALPVALVVLAFVATTIAPALFSIAGLCMIAAGATLKFILVTRAGYNEGFALAHTPMRGSGAGGPAVKPGW
jgi:phenylacetyl-CoA:acceptor oxidoreductase subunit 2